MTFEHRGMTGRGVFVGRHVELAERLPNGLPDRTADDRALPREPLVRIGQQRMPEPDLAVDVEFARHAGGVAQHDLALRDIGHERDRRAVTRACLPDRAGRERGAGRRIDEALAPFGMAERHRLPETRFHAGGEHRELLLVGFRVERHAQRSVRPFAERAFSGLQVTRELLLHARVAHGGQRIAQRTHARVSGSSRPHGRARSQAIATARFSRRSARRTRRSAAARSAGSHGASR